VRGFRHDSFFGSDIAVRRCSGGRWWWCITVKLRACKFISPWCIWEAHHTFEYHEGFSGSSIHSISSCTQPSHTNPQPRSNSKSITITCHQPSQAPPTPLSAPAVFPQVTHRRCFSRRTTHSFFPGGLQYPTHTRYSLHSPQRQESGYTYAWRLLVGQ
jgi:hypothetical protein